MAKKMKAKLPVAKPPLAIEAPYKRTKEDEARERRYRAEDGLRAIQRAEEIKSDKSLMSDIKALANEQVSNLKKFCK